MLRPITHGLRGLSFLMALVVLALAANLIAIQVYGTPPVTTRYCTFTGGFGMIVAAVTTVCTIFLSSTVPELVPIVLDGLAGLFFLGGGIAWAYSLKDTANCSNYDQMLLNPLLNQGSLTVGDRTAYGVVGSDDDVETVMNRLKGNCQRAQADEVIQFICFGIGIALVAIGLVQMRRGLGGGARRTGAYV
ncbi:marvel domain-containing protein [Chaetomium fimeti]|uniref:Marvel domain-containing protein n=1 Tax=Chaetomium fimeti TaxID=1854472 RepID=A0AAE0HCQ4_9PEZI|nr:marvel domain-containing protein [Chaetomium fimeti]